MKKVLLISLFYSSLYAAQCAVPSTPTKDEPAFEKVVYEWSRTFAEVFHIVGQKHYKVTDFQTCLTKSLDSLLTCLDPHSNFLDPKAYKNIMESTSGEFFGIGVVIDNTRQSKDKFLLIVDTIAGGPADKAGIKPIDKIVEIDGHALEGMSTDEATAKLRGERNTKVHVKTLREGHPDILSFEITRDVIQEQSSLCFYLPEQNIYYLSLTTFSDNSVKQLEELLNQAKKKQYKALILDLRNNSGGLLSAAIDIAGMFIEKGNLVVITKSKDNQKADRYVTARSPITSGAIPIFILINNYTASAAEILAGCLKIHSSKSAKNKNMVFLVGSKTFGKGSVQEVMPISNNCAVKITTSLYYLPDDSTIQGLGIEPDFVIERKFPPTEQMMWFAKYYGQERSLANYIKPPDSEQITPEDPKHKNKKEGLTWSERAQQTLTTDSQLREALSLINIYHTGKTCCPAQVETRQKAIEFIKKNYVTNETIQLVEVKI